MTLINYMVLTAPWHKAWDPITVEMFHRRPAPLSIHCPGHDPASTGSIFQAFVCPPRAQSCLAGFQDVLGPRDRRFVCVCACVRGGMLITWAQWWFKSICFSWSIIMLLYMPHFASSIFPANIHPYDARVDTTIVSLESIQGSSSLGPASELHWPAGHWRLSGPRILCRGWKDCGFLQTLRIPKCSARYWIPKRTFPIYRKKVTNGHQFRCWIDATSLVRRLCRFCLLKFGNLPTNKMANPVGLIEGPLDEYLDGCGSRGLWGIGFEHNSFN